MMAETFLAAMALICLAYLQSGIFAAFDLSIPAAPTCCIETQGVARIVGFFGAGVYEEVLFRLALIPLIAAFLRAAGESQRGSVWGAAMAASLIFSAAHYQAFTHLGDPFCLDTFCFRFAAGMVFSALFIYRGFGITAAAHTLYDVSIAFLAA
jgi:membrane protease YdiL (CAAX protease family)